LSEDQGPQNRIEQLADDKLSRRIRFVVRREIKHLEEKLGEGEEVLNLAQGQYDEKNGLVALTDRRVLFVEEGLIRKQLEDFPYEKISSVQTSTGMMHGKLTIFGSGNKAVIDKIYPKQRTVEIGEHVRSRIAASSMQPTPPPSSNPTSSGNPAGRLRRLAELRDAGAITTEDFEAQKLRILGEM
jgi:hypothetical protein